MIITLTGRISSGKDTVLSLLKVPFFYKLIDADKLGHKLLLEPVIKAKIIKRFGEELLTSTGELDLVKLAQKVFPLNIQEFNKLIHPYLKKLIKDEMTADCIINAALIEELGLKKLSDLVIVVDCSDDNIYRRSKHKVTTDIMSVQKSRKWYKDQADILIDNNSTMENLKREVKLKCRDLF